VILSRGLSHPVLFCLGHSGLSAMAFAPAPVPNDHNCLKSRSVASRAKKGCRDCFIALRSSNFYWRPNRHASACSQLLVKKYFEEPGVARGG